VSNNPLQKLSFQEIEQYLNRLPIFQAEQQMQDEQLYRLLWELMAHAHILDKMAEGVSVADKAGNFFFTNPATEAIFGYEPGELIGRQVWSIIDLPPEENAQLAAHIIERLKTQRNWVGETRCRRKDGTSFTLYAQVTALNLADQEYWVAVVEDITERKRAEEALRQYTHQLEALRQVGLELTAELDLQQLLNNILIYLEHVIPYDSAAVLLLEGDFLQTVAGRGFPDLEQALKISFPLKEGFVSQVQQWRQPIYLHDVQAEPKFKIQGNTDYVRGWLSVPLIVREELIGYLTLDSRWAGAYGQTEADLAQTFANQAAIAIQNARLFEAERSTRRQLRNLASYLQTAREKERTTIAREIHDEFGQSLTALKLDLAWLAKRLPEDEPELSGKVASMAELIDTTMELVHRIATELRPGLLDDLGLAAAIEWQLQEFARRTELDYELQIDDEITGLNHDLETAIFRIFQEILTNITRHAMASQVKVRLESRFDKLMLQVSDNGIGISPAQVNNPKSLGLIGMRERAHSWGGTLAIEGIPNQGTTVTLRLHWSRMEEGAYDQSADRG
jgi:PAS domain S-box-containing protein